MRKRRRELHERLYRLLMGGHVSSFAVFHQEGGELLRGAFGLVAER